MRMTIQIAVRIPENVAHAIDRAVERGEYATRTEAVRVALEGLAKRVRDDEIRSEYERAYGAVPQEEWIGSLGLSLMAAATADESQVDEQPAP